MSKIELYATRASKMKGQGKCGGEVRENFGILFVATIPVMTIGIVHVWGVGKPQSLAISPREQIIRLYKTLNGGQERSASMKRQSRQESSSAIPRSGHHKIKSPRTAAHRTLTS